MFSAFERFDYAILRFLDVAIPRSPSVDATVGFVSNLPLLKGGVLIALLWAAWFKRASDQQSAREMVIATLTATIVAETFVKVLRNVLPFRLRPLFDPASGVAFSQELGADSLWNWSSFPSDTAAMIFALATGLFLISRKVGTFALLYSAFVIALPRVYLGYHYPTDIIAGAFIGILLAIIANHGFTRRALSYFPIRLSETYPSLFYGLSFLISYEIASVFDTLRRIIGFLH